MTTISADRLDIFPDIDSSIEIIKHAGAWLQDVTGEVSEWWDPEVVSAEFLAPHARPNEFITAFVDGRPAATAIMQTKQDMQDWSGVDGDTEPSALYVHYVATEREFAGQGLVACLIDYATNIALEQRIPVLRLDTNADEPKLCRLYESLGFVTVKVLNEGEYRTVLYERLANYSQDPAKS